MISFLNSFIWMKVKALCNRGYVRDITVCGRRHGTQNVESSQQRNTVKTLLQCLRAVV